MSIWKRAGWCPWMLAVADGNQTQYAKPARHNTLFCASEKKFTRTWFYHILVTCLRGNQTQYAKPHKPFFPPGGHIERATFQLHAIFHVIRPDMPNTLVGDAFSARTQESSYCDHI